MTSAFIPYQTHTMIRNACAAVLVGLNAALRSRKWKTRLLDHASKLVVDMAPVIWYAKDTKVDLFWTPKTGFVILDHVRRLRSPGIQSLNDALKARTFSLKEAIDHELRLAQEALEAVGVSPSTE